jgi:hypothetical protein
MLVSTGVRNSSLLFATLKNNVATSSCLCVALKGFLYSPINVPPVAWSLSNYFAVAQPVYGAGATATFNTIEVGYYTDVCLVWVYN